MAARQTMEARPPVLIERILSVLLPPHAREHVLGDLAERYSTPARYLVEGLRLLPFVVASQIRRTTNVGWLMFPALLLFVAFGSGGGEAFWIRGGLPTAIGLAALVLRDAYRVSDVRRPWRQGVVDVLTVGAAVLVSQLVLGAAYPAWLAVPGIATRAGVCLALLFVIRVQNPAGGVYPSPQTMGVTMSLDELRQEVRVYEQGTRRAVRIELGAAVIVVAAFSAMALAGGPMALRVGATLGAAGGLFVARRMWVGLRQPALPRGEVFADTAAFYTVRLERQRHNLLTMWRWYGLPLAAGPAVVFLSAAVSSPRPWIGSMAVIGGLLLVGLVFHRLVCVRLAAVLRVRIDTLRSVEEAP